MDLGLDLGLGWGRGGCGWCLGEKGGLGCCTVGASRCFGVVSGGFGWLGVGVGEWGGLGEGWSKRSSSVFTVAHPRTWRLRGNQRETGLELWGLTFGPRGSASSLHFFNHLSHGERWAISEACGVTKAVVLMLGQHAGSGFQGSQHQLRWFGRPMAFQHQGVDRFGHRPPQKNEKQ